MNSPHTSKRSKVKPKQSLNSLLLYSVDDDYIQRKKKIQSPIIPEPDQSDANSIHSMDSNHSVHSIHSNSSHNSQNSHSSQHSNESLNLKERQIAINTTHPFGIKIWKPSLYKKIRSVENKSVEDIHDLSNISISLPIQIANFIWIVTFGLLFFIICLLGSLIITIANLLILEKHKSNKAYGKVLIKLGKYLLNPFGKIVTLVKDENYLFEDELDGRSLREYQKWRCEEEGLFFAPPKRSTNQGGINPTTNIDDFPHLNSSFNSNLLDRHDRENERINERTKRNSRQNESIPLLPNSEEDSRKRYFGRGAWSFSRLLFYTYFYTMIQPMLLVISLLCWLGVFTIPMSKVCMILGGHLRRHPLALNFGDSLLPEYRTNRNDSNTNSDITSPILSFQNNPVNQNQGNSYNSTSQFSPNVLNSQILKNNQNNKSILICTFRSCAFHYYKYTIDGTNIFFINLLSSVLFVIIDYHFLKSYLHWDYWYTNSSFIFGGCLFSIIPLAYFIGQAVASISAQSSMGVGAVINAFFSTIVEIFLYCVALNQNKGQLVEGSMIGSILGGVLLLPGLSMCGGAFKRKTQRYNPRSAGVSCMMLLFGCVVLFSPSVFYQIYGNYEIRCGNCVNVLQGSLIGNGDDCKRCHFIQPALSLDKLYLNILKPFSVICAVALFTAYMVGLWFTLRTHAALIWATTSHDQQQAAKKELGLSPSFTSLNPHNPDSIRHDSISSMNFDKSFNHDKGQSSSQNPVIQSQLQNHEKEESNGHDAPNWSRTKSSIILLSATLVYAAIAEILVDTVDEVLKEYPINPKFLGLTVFALVPNTTEFLNAISFAISGNVALSMEIGSAYALQVVLIQIPSLVIYSIYKKFDDVEKIFSLIFPRWDLVACVVSIYLFTYIYAEGKSNYFKGVILILIYLVVLCGFWFNGKIVELGIY